MQRAHPLIAAVLLSSSASTAINTATIPTSWREPMTAELSDEWRNRHRARYAVASGDFNGDGVEDKAMLLVAKKGGRVGLFVFLSKGEGRYAVHGVDVRDDIRALRYLGIEDVKPGTYRTACGKGYWNCASGEVEHVTVEFRAIRYFKHESAESIVFWNKKTRGLERVWISD